MAAALMQTELGEPFAVDATLETRPARFDADLTAGKYATLAEGEAQIAKTDGGRYFALLAVKTAIGTVRMAVALERQQAVELEQPQDTTTKTGAETMPQAMTVDLGETIAQVTAALLEKFPDATPQKVASAVTVAAQACLERAAGNLDGEAIALVVKQCNSSGEDCDMLEASYDLLQTHAAFWQAYYAVVAHAQPLPPSHPSAAFIRSVWPSVGAPSKAPRVGAGRRGRSMVVTGASMTDGWQPAAGPQWVIDNRNKIDFDGIQGQQGDDELEG